MYRSQDLNAESYTDCIAQLQSNGQFSDFIAAETSLKNSKSFKSTEFDTQGKTVMQLQPTFNSNNLELNTEQLKPGVYVVGYKNRIGKLIVN